MLEHMIKNENLIFYILAAELFLLLLIQLRTNGLLKKSLKIRAQKKENIKQLKEEVKGGKSDIPVVRFEKHKPAVQNAAKPEKSGSMDPKEMAVLQEMMTEFFG